MRKTNEVIEQKIESLLLEKLKEKEFADCFLIESRLHANNKLEVFIDSDTDVTFEKCSKISRYLESHIEENKWLGENYTLEVSSPGVGRPLKFLRQYKKNIGRNVEITLKNGTTKNGLLLKTDDENLYIQEKIPVKEGKKKTTQIVETEIPFNEVKKTIVKIVFK
jgi:ribosome maturation factor RimP